MFPVQNVYLTRENKTGEKSWSVCCMYICRYKSIQLSICYFGVYNYYGYVLVFYKSASYLWQGEMAGNEKSIKDCVLFCHVNLWRSSESESHTLLFLER